MNQPPSSVENRAVAGMLCSWSLRPRVRAFFTQSGAGMASGANPMQPAAVSTAASAIQPSRARGVGAIRGPLRGDVGAFGTPNCPRALTADVLASVDAQCRPGDEP